jgi:hypothetical protein
MGLNMTERTSKEWEDRYYGANSVINHMSDVIEDLNISNVNLKEEVNTLSKENQRLRNIINDIRNRTMGVA